jgi:hypothetical protein
MIIMANSYIVGWMTAALIMINSRGISNDEYKEKIIINQMPNIVDMQKNNYNNNIKDYFLEKDKQKYELTKKYKEDITNIESLTDIKTGIEKIIDSPTNVKYESKNYRIEMPYKL